MADDDRKPGLRMAGVGLEFAAAVAGLSLLGYWIDSHFGTAPWALLIGALIGIVGGTYNLIRDSLRGSRRSPGPPGDAPGPGSGGG